MSPSYHRSMHETSSSAPSSPIRVLAVHLPASQLLNRVWCGLHTCAFLLLLFPEAGKMIPFQYPSRSH
ncbi:hypothetical protein BJX96DRAFT_155425 [Aspergillus floccosus]